MPWSLCDICRLWEDVHCLRSVGPSANSERSSQWEVPSFFKPLDVLVALIKDYMTLCFWQKSANLIPEFQSKRHVSKLTCGFGSLMARIGRSLPLTWTFDKIVNTQKYSQCQSHKSRGRRSTTTALPNKSLMRHMLPIQGVRTQLSKRSGPESYDTCIGGCPTLWIICQVV